MRIVFLSDDFPPQSFGGAGISTYDLAAGMKKAGHEVFVITTCRNVPKADETIYKDLPVFEIKSNYAGRWRWYFSLYNPPVVRQVSQILKKIQPDIVHVNNVHFYLSYYSIRVSKQYADVVVWTARDVMSFNFAKLTTKRYLEHFDCRTSWIDHVSQARKRWNPFRNFLIRKFLQIPDALFSVSVALQKALEQNGIPNVKVTHTGVDLSEWQFAPAKVDRFKEKFGLTGKKVVLFGGRLSEAKGGLKVLEAMSNVVKKFPEAVILVVSNVDGHTQEMSRVAAQLGIEKHLVFTGWVAREDMRLTYGSADVVLVPSICFDSFPRVVIEAMAAGKPVIGTWYGGASEIIQNNVTGYIVNPFDSSEMAEKILDLLQNANKREQFGLASRKRVKTSFNLSQKVTDLIAIYTELRNKKSV